MSPPRSSYRSARRAARAAALALALAACSGKKGRAAVTHDAAGSTAAGARQGPPDAALGPGGDVLLPPAPPVPAPPAGRPPLPQLAVDAPTAEQVALGALLFFEKRLSVDGTTRCASCHDPAHGLSGVDARSQNALGKPNVRHTPSLYDLAWHTELGWDGRGGDRLRFVAGHATGQLGGALEESVRRVLESPTYQAHFARTGPLGHPGHTAAAALAAYALTRYSPESPWDRQERGLPDGAGAQAVSGYALFNGKAQCATCHPPPLYTDLAYHRLGLVASPDDGRGRIDPGATGGFKTPGLRGAVHRARFFHDGSATTLEAAIDWHLDGGRGQGADPSIVDPALVPVTLTADERAALYAFVRALSGPPLDVGEPALPGDFP